MARILIMDDDELIIKMLRMALENRKLWSSGCSNNVIESDPPAFF